jgi:hypothetical protein
MSNKIVHITVQNKIDIEHMFETRSYRISIYSLCNLLTLQTYIDRSIHRLKNTDINSEIIVQIYKIKIYSAQNQNVIVR